MKNKESHFLRTYKHDLTETVHEWSLDGPLQSLPYLCDFKIQDGHNHRISLKSS